jgi:hypothetical protein
MRFFTKEWLSGELTDAAFDAVPTAYHLHLAMLQLPLDVSTLTTVDIHDAVLLAIQHEPQSAQLTLLFRCGDLQRGYFNLNIKYSGVVLDEETLSVVYKAMQTQDEFLYDEVDRLDDHFEHRFILSSHNEVRVSFATVTVDSYPVECRATV